MASITVRNLDPHIKRRLRIRAARHNRSMEEEVRSILRVTLAGESERSRGLVEAIRRRFAPLGGVELPVLPREPMREPPQPGK